MMKRAVLFVLMIAASVAAQSTKPADVVPPKAEDLPVYGLKAKNDAPGWVAEAVKNYKAKREKLARQMPEIIATCKKSLADVKAAKIDPNLKTPSRTVRGGDKVVYTFRDEAARQEKIKHFEGLIVDHMATLGRVHNPKTPPDAGIPKGESIAGHLEPAK